MLNSKVKIMTSSKSPSSDIDQYVLMNPLPKHYLQIQELCKRVYPFSKPWSLEQMESHHSYFPDGQLIVVDMRNNKVVGLAFSLIILWNDYSPQDNWQDFTSGGFFHNHNPKKGKTFYGAEVMVDPECRGKGLGKMLYAGRKKIVEKYSLIRIRAGARLRGYSKFSEKLSPYEYAREVITKKIYDPTLSFQLGQGFKVIDVAPNYLFNDPESLGHAAVIEWINPMSATAKDLENHKRSANLFLSGEKYVPEHLPKELRRLVRKTSTVLGQIIQEMEGEQFFRRVEFFREQLKKTRGHKKNSEQLKFLIVELSKESQQNQFKLAHAFSLQLEMINVCEAAYRTWRQRQKSLPQGMKSKLNLIYVLTAHPTEARSKVVVEILSRLQGLLVEGIHNNFFFNDFSIATQIRMLWLHPLSKIKRPSVIDEAEYIFSLVFSPDVFDFILCDKPGYEIRLRTWVGGDKDGHPGVNKDVMKQCLNRSREFILKFISQKLKTVILDLKRLSPITEVKKSEIETVESFESSLKKFQTIVTGDGTKVKTWSVKFNTYLKKAHAIVKKHEQILLIRRILEIFPAFVLPIELREDSHLIKKSLTDSTSAIRGMLTELDRIAGAMDITFYARGLVISHCEEVSDIENACNLVDLACKGRTLPAIPLFETKEALVTSKKILKNYFKDKKNLERVKRHWENKFEIMLGYSDSAKEIGVFPSRLLIAKAMDELEKVVKSFRIKPIFFQGSGGSVARGGGSLKEQISWWSQSAIEAPKMTVQGEMIQRLFTTKEILNSQCAHLTTEAFRKKVRKQKKEIVPELDIFAQSVQQEYSKLVSDTPLLMHLLEATPYRYLDLLKIGSRPSKRPTDHVTINSLRAIPWVLCWTQTRVLIPTWWGIGTSWKKLKLQEKNKLKALYLENLFFSSFVKTLGFTLAKVELDVWEMYFQGKDNTKLFKKIRLEYLHAVEFVREMSGEKQLIWYRPWLDESIRLRSPHIHVLNLAQILAIRNSNEALLRESIVGIACGMLTTG